MKSVGITVGGYAKIFSLTPFNEVDINQIKGKIDKSETNINTECIEIFARIFFNIE